MKILQINKNIKLLYMSRSKMSVNKVQPKKGSLKSKKGRNTKPKTPPKPKPKSSKSKPEGKPVTSKTAKAMRPYRVHKERKRTQKSSNRSLKMLMRSFLQRKKEDLNSNSSSDEDIEQHIKLLKKSSSRYKDKRVIPPPKFKMVLFVDENGIQYMGNVEDLQGRPVLLPPKKVVTRGSKLALEQ
tara:strand:+ start:1205 stop:1756 length:552 start_codon:yes stop_codon:yes gene_type:complete